MKEKSPTIYARLMNVACDQSRHELQNHIETRIAGFATDLTDELAVHIRNAYTAGIVDGFRDAVMKAEGNGDGKHAGRLASILAPLLLIVKSDHPEGEGVEGLPSLLAAAERELDAGNTAKRSGASRHESV